MDPATIAFLGSLGLKGLSALFGGKAKKKRNIENRNTTIAGLNLKQKMGEDRRIGRLDLANSILSRVPTTTAGGRVNTNVALDPALVAQLRQPRTYDFGSAVPDENVGAGSAFLSGLFGGAGDIASSMYKPGSEGAGNIQGLSLDDLMKLQHTQPGAMPCDPASGEC